MQEMTEKWAVKIHRSGYGLILGSLLDAMKPVGFIGAQFAYLLDPFVGTKAISLNDLGEVLEDPGQLTELAKIMRGGMRT